VVWHEDRWCIHLHCPRHGRPPAVSLEQFPGFVKQGRVDVVIRLVFPEELAILRVGGDDSCSDGRGQLRGLVAEDLPIVARKQANIVLELGREDREVLLSCDASALLHSMHCVAEDGVVPGHVSRLESVPWFFHPAVATWAHLRTLCGCVADAPALCAGSHAAFVRHAVFSGGSAILHLGLALDHIFLNDQVHRSTLRHGAVAAVGDPTVEGCWCKQQSSTYRQGSNDPLGEPSCTLRQPELRNAALLIEISVHLGKYSGLPVVLNLHLSTMASAQSKWTDGR